MPEWDFLQSMKKTILITVSSVSILISIVAVYSAVTAPRTNFNRFLAAVAMVEIGKTRLDVWRAIVERNQRSQLNVVCGQRTCGIGWRGENSLLSRLHLAPRTVADASVGFQDGIASSVFIVLEVEKHDKTGDWRDEKMVVVRQDITIAPKACRPGYRVNLQTNCGAEDCNRVIVAMDSCVSSEDRARALAINTSCLTRLGGCKTVESMIPQVLNH
ncbi:MAG: hypothetical protein WAM87_14630 [Terriglobales bacterium]